jgi:hypothetical protein
MMDVTVKELEEQAQMIIDGAVDRIRKMGFGVVGDGTVHGNGIWIDRLRVRIAKDKDAGSE